MLSEFTLTSMCDELVKIGEDQSKEKRPSHPAVTALKSLGAYGLGHLTGEGTLRLGNYLSNRYREKPLISRSFATSAIPVVAGLGSLALLHAQHTTFDKMRDDAAKRRAIRVQQEP